MKEMLPLAVDLDGTLVRTDTMAEAFFTLVKDKPHTAFQLLYWMKSGRSKGKHEIASRAHILADLLPYNEECITWLKAEKKRGRKLYLVTGTNEKFAHMVADHVGIFDGVVASDKDRLMTGSDKAQKLIELFGDGQFAYAGNSSVDLAVWKHAGERILVNTSKSVAKAAEKLGAVSKTIGTHALTPKVFLKAIRWHQWTKNLLIFVPLLTAHQLLSPPAFTSALLAFISFCAIASAIYLMNDLVDLPSDRQHPYKKYRPLAAGTMTIRAAVIAGFLLGVISLSAAALLPPAFIGFILLYALLNLAYSFKLKKIIGIDVLLIASLYVLRIFAGSVATAIDVSPWLLTFAGLVFISLALVKRTSEVINLLHNGKEKAAGRGYGTHHRLPLLILGIASSYLSLFVLVFYIRSPAVTPLYNTPQLLWLLIPLFGFWLHRIWTITKKGNMHEDPTVFAAKDWFSYAIATASVIIVFLAA